MPELNRSTCPWLILLVSLWLVATASAADYAAAFVENGVGPRAQGLGGAFVAVADDASASYWNPAGLVRTHGKSALASLQLLSLDRRQNSLSFAMNPRGKLAFGITWQHAGVGDLVGRTASGTPTGDLRDTENAFYIAVGWAAHQRLALGFTMKRLTHRIKVPVTGAASGSGTGLDLGTCFDLSPRITLAATLQNLGAKLNWQVKRSSQQSSHTTDELPVVLTLGLACRPVAGLLLTADGHLNNIDPYLNLGTEWTLNPLLTVRAGLNRVAGDEPRIGSTAVGLTLRPMRREALQLYYTYATDALDAGNRTLAGMALQF